MTRTLQFSGKAPEAPPAPAHPDDRNLPEVEQGDSGQELPQASVSVSGELFSQRFRENPSTGDVDSLVSDGQASDLPWQPKEPGPLKEGDRFKGYRIVKEIGFGGYARVYHAIDEFLEVDLAIKVIFRQGRNPKEIAARAMAEARFLQTVYSPYVVRVHQAGLTDANLFFIVMELLDGRSLRSILLKRKKLTWKMALPLFAKIAEGVQAAHQMSVIHRDLKPENIFVVRDGTPKVLDFGIAKFMDKPPITTRENHFHGTPPYMSPEQLSGRPVTVRSDIYALGIILYEALAGRHPMLMDGGDNDPNSVAYRNIYIHPPLLNVVDPSIHKPVARLVNRLIAKSPDLRPPSMTEVARELLACFDKCQAAKRGLFAVFSTGGSDPISIPEPPNPSQLLLDDEPAAQQPTSAPPPPAKVVQPQLPPVAPRAQPVGLASPRPAIGLTRALRFERPTTRSVAPGPQVKAENAQARAEAKASPAPNTARWHRVAVQWLTLAVVGLSIGGATMVLYMRSADVRKARTPPPVASPSIPLVANKAPIAAPSVAVTSIPTSSSAASAAPPPVAGLAPTPTKVGTKLARPADKSDRFVKALEEELKRRQAKSAASASPDLDSLLFKGNDPSKPSRPASKKADAVEPFINR